MAAIARCVGGGAGAAIVAEESLDEEGIELLGRSVTAQPAWSDFPIIVLTGGGATTPYTEMMVRSRTPMGNLNLIERPLRPATLISSVRTAIRSRSGSTKFAIISRSANKLRKNCAAHTTNWNLWWRSGP